MWPRKLNAVADLVSV